MKKIFSYNLKIGMSFDQPVYVADDTDNIFLRAYEPVTATALKKLEGWKIKELSTNGELIKLVETKSPNDFVDAEIAIEIEIMQKKLKKLVATKAEFNLFLESSGKVLRHAYENMIAGKPVDMNHIRSIAEEIVNWIKENSACMINIIHSDHTNNLAQHALVASFWGSRLAENLGFSKPRIVEVAYAILFMDIGMTRVPEAILNKKENLSVEEKKIIETHTVTGYNTLFTNNRLKKKISLVALQHHENFDGSGYPKKIKLYEIDEYARIASIADSFTAMLETKTYRAEPYLPYLSMKDLLSSNLNRYDPKYLKAFCDSISVYPIGSLVLLSDDSINMVVAPNSGKPMRPMILTLRTQENYKPAKPRIVSLASQTQLYIRNSLEPKDVNIYPAAELETIFG